jgi:hypothetical protein
MIPAGLTFEDHKPIGMQLYGRPFGESSLFRRLPSRASSRSQASSVAAMRAASQALFIAMAREGNLPMPQSLPVRMPSSTRAWTRCATSM